MYGAIGVHPDEVGNLDETQFARMERLLDKEKIKAVGEIGLDYYWDKENHDLQKEWFIRQLDLAAKKRETGLSTAGSCRRYDGDYERICVGTARRDTLLFILGGDGKRVCEKGYYIGIGGVVTFKNAKKLKETVQEIPLESIVLETDCPYLAPEPFRGKRNCSLYISYVAEKIAELKGISAEEVIRQTEENAKQLYQIDESRLLKEQVIE